MSSSVEAAAAVLRQGGVIAYPTEYCFGLGCDPLNGEAVQRILQIKNRDADQGVLLIAACTAQVEAYADLNATPKKNEVLDSWPGPTTWVLPTQKPLPNWIVGKHNTIAMRVTAHKIAAQLCNEFGGAIVSTSANRHGQPELLTASDVQQAMGEEVDLVLDAAVGDATRASQIRDGITGRVLR